MICTFIRILWKRNEFIAHIRILLVIKPLLHRNKLQGAVTQRTIKRILAAARNSNLDYMCLHISLRISSNIVTMWGTRYPSG
jgi:hypothetical protein